ncbi:Fur family transcriptional regulator [Nonomuraea sp. MTCD27]|uniref:Fur family transcriptional regulator n=1 Tax=Nonomuraea sp. MTCD27 TaxID=1676747 RepID=UPI0035C0025B
MRDRPGHGGASRSLSADDPADRLRQASLRVTKQRIAVLRVLERHPHSDAGFVAQAVREEMGAVSTQAVHDILAALGDAGLVGKIEPASLPALFELRTHEDHHHVVCWASNAVADVG